MKRISSIAAGFQLKENIYTSLLYRLGIVMVMLMVCRIGFYLFNLQYFPDMTLTNFLRLCWGGLTFDLATMFYVNMLYIVLMILPFDFRFHPYYKKTLQYLFLLTNGAAFAANVADFVYYRFTLRRTTADVFQQFENETNMGGLWLSFFVDYWYAVLFWVVLMAATVWLYGRVRFKGPQLRNRLMYYVIGVLVIPIVATAVIGGIRGGFRHSTRPITLSNAGEYVTNPRDISIVLNTPFAVIRTIGKTQVQKATYFADDEVETIYSPVQVPKDSASFKPHNVVIIILESFSKEFVGGFNKEKEQGNYKGYTPFLDSLIPLSRTFEYSFANGRKSIDGLPSVISSIPSLGVPYFLSPYSSNRINSLASLLKEKGYHTSFFHGAPNGSMGFQAFMNLAGVQKYYGMNEYTNPTDYDGMWGIWDEPFLQFYADQLNTFQQPFMSSFFSVSSHHPFKIPVQYEEKFKGGPLVIHRCVQYTDYALRQFFKKASAMPWYNNTLFVITADHTSSEIQFDEARTAWGVYSVPVLFFAPDGSLAGHEVSIAQQIDIMPSVLGYLGYDKTYVAFGRNVFDTATTPFAFNYKDNAYQLFEGDYLLQFDGTSTVGFFNFRSDKLLTKNMIGDQPEVQRTMERKIKAIIQQYNNRMIADKLTVESTLR